MTTLSTIIAATASAVLAVATAAIAAAPPKAASSTRGGTNVGSTQKSIVETAVGAGSFNTLVTALKTAGLVESLQGPGPFTVFAPTDEAFAKLPPDTLKSLLEPANCARLTSVLTFHVVPDNLAERDLTSLSGATTLQGQRVQLKSTNGGLMVGGAKVIQTGIACGNGTIHVIDSVMMPTSDTIADRAASAGTFGTLLAAAKAAGLDGALAGPGLLTVFAPTDEAFAKLPAGTVEQLLKPENKAKLASILSYHIVQGRVYAADAAKFGRADTLLGQPIIIDVRDGRLTVNGASIVASDIDAANGVIHVIDTVILPAGG